MIYTQIEVNGKFIKVEEVVYSDLVKFFTDAAFMAFMDEGRSGLRRIARDFVDNLRFKWSVPRNISEEHEQYHVAEQLLVDGFITHGSAGLADGVRSVHQVVWLARVESQS
jgi:hypothetical protein